LKANNLKVFGIKKTKGHEGHMFPRDKNSSDNNYIY